MRGGALVLAATSPSSPKSMTTNQTASASSGETSETDSSQSLIPPSFPTDILWIAQSLNGKPYTQENNRPTFTLTSSKTIIGFSGCNRFTSTAQWGPNTLDIQPFALTRMACSPQEMASENTYLLALRSMRTWSKDKQGLLKLSGDKGTLIFKHGLFSQ
jgi:heat shock protein HslJ